MCLSILIFSFLARLTCETIVTSSYTFLILNPCASSRKNFICIWISFCQILCKLMLRVKRLSSFYFLTVQKWARFPKLIQTNLVFGQYVSFVIKIQNEFRIDASSKKWMSRLPNSAENNGQRIQGSRLGTRQTVLDGENENYSEWEKCFDQGLIFFNYLCQVINPYKPYIIWRFIYKSIIL